MTKEDTSNSTSNYQLMQRIKKSNHIAFKVLYDRLWEPLYLRAYALLGDKNIAKDIVQDVWISVWERKHKIKNDNIEGFLFKAVRYRVYNEFRNSKYKNKLIEDFVKNYNPIKNANNTEQIIQLKDTEKIILNVVDTLPKKCKQVFKLSRFEGMKNDEIAKKLNISKRTVETHISNALKKLKNNVALGLAIFLELF